MVGDCGIGGERGGEQGEGLALGGAKRVVEGAGDAGVDGEHGGNVERGLGGSSAGALPGRESVRIPGFDPGLGARNGAVGVGVRLAGSARR